MLSAVSVSEITAPFRPLCDYSSLSPYALSAITLPEYKKTDSPILCSSRRGIGIRET